MAANAELVKKLEESEKARMDKVLEESDTSKVRALLLIGFSHRKILREHFRRNSYSFKVQYGVFFLSKCAVLKPYFWPLFHLIDQGRAQNLVGVDTVHKG